MKSVILWTRDSFHEKQRLKSEVGTAEAEPTYKWIDGQSAFSE